MSQINGMNIIWNSDEFLHNENYQILQKIRIYSTMPHSCATSVIKFASRPHHPNINNPPTTMDNSSAPGRTTANLSDIEVAYILRMSDAGASQTAISAQIDRSRSAVANAIKNYDIKTFTGVAPPPGNPKILSEYESRTLLRVTKKNRRRTFEDITNILSDKLSKRTLQRRLSTLGIKKHIAIKKPFLTDDHKCQWLEFCEEC